jgi:hypothetical protein
MEISELIRPDIPAFNFIGNPSFDLWQAGTSFVGVIYGADLWKQLTTAGRTMSRQAGFSGATYCSRMQRDNGQSGITNMPIGFVVPSSLAVFLAGQPIMISADIRVGTLFSGSTISLAAVTGTGTDELLNISASTFPTGSASSNLGSITPGTTAARYSWGPFAVPAGTTELGGRLNAVPSGTAGATDYYETTNWNLHIGSIAVPFRPTPITETIARAYRRYQKSFILATTPAQNAGAGTAETYGIAGKAGATAQYIPITFPMPMLAAPTMTLYNPAATNAQVRDLTAAADCSASAGTENLTERGVVITATGNASTAVGNKLGVHWIADARTF